ncbi:MAG: hypothetical protein FJ109_18485 [Deltaproteobacteria bacterium]|nr:hypothetical protein [Deltaproteobacteria bacterium]
MKDLVSLAIEAGTKRFGLMPALDLDELDDAVRAVASVGRLDAICGFKVGFSLGLGFGLPEVVRRLRAVTDKPIIYDHQKGGTDIPETGPLFARAMAKAQVDAAILFPQAGPKTLAAWVGALEQQGVGVIVGGVMTHPGYLKSEGGYLDDDAVAGIYSHAVEAGVRSFVLPLTRPQAAERIVERSGIAAGWTCYSPGFGAQQGDPSRFGFVRRHVLIVGRALLSAADPAAYVNRIAEELARTP